MPEILTVFFFKFKKFISITLMYYSNKLFDKFYYNDFIQIDIDDLKYIKFKYLNIRLNSLVNKQYIQYSKNNSIMQHLVQIILKIKVCTLLNSIIFLHCQVHC